MRDDLITQAAIDALSIDLAVRLPCGSKIDFDFLSVGTASATCQTNALVAIVGRTSAFLSLASEKVAKIVHCGLSRVTRCTCRVLRSNARTSK